MTRKAAIRAPLPPAEPYTGVHPPGFHEAGQAAWCRRCTPRAEAAPVERWLVPPERARPPMEPEPVHEGLPWELKGTPGPPIAVVCTPPGRRACVVTSDGELVRGFVRPLGSVYGQNETRHVGPEVRFRDVTASGEVIVDGDGRELHAHYTGTDLRTQVRFL